MRPLSPARVAWIGGVAYAVLAALFLAAGIASWTDPLVLDAFDPPIVRRASALSCFGLPTAFATCAAYLALVARREPS